MNGKKAKRLRAAARSIQTDQPWLAYVGRKSEKGRIQLLLHPHCGRKFYKEMKQGKRAVRFISDAQMAAMLASGNVQGIAG